MDGCYRWHLARGRDDIIGEAGRQELTGGVVNYLFVEGRPDALGDRAVNLAVDDRGPLPRLCRNALAATLGDGVGEFCTSADRRLVILFGPQAAFRLRDKAAAPTA
jgi:hypothetical protein